MTDTIPILAELSLIKPELLTCIGAIALLMVGAYCGNRVTSLLVFAASLILVAASYLLTTQMGATAFAFQGMLRLDDFTIYSKLLVLFGAFLALLLSLDWLKPEDNRRFEYPILLLLSVVGLMLLISANDLLSLYMALELSSLALYVMAAFDRDNPKASEAGLKYFVLGALASGMMLFGASLVYGFSGTTNFSVLSQLFVEHNGQPVSPGLVVGLVMVIVGLSFKISAVPFHMWTPDVYEGAPTPVVAFFAVAPKIAALVILIRLLMQPFMGLFEQWQPILAVASALSMLVGAFGALRQSNIKRLLAYSSIGHVGYALMGVAAAGEAGIEATMLYLSLYLFMSIGAFGFIMLLQRQGRPVELISELGGLSKQSPKLAFFMALMMFSMAGIPPLAGFFGKMYVFMSVIDQKLYWLVAIGLLSSVVAAFYYIKIVKVMYFDEVKEPFDHGASWSTSCVLALCGFVVLFFFLSPTHLISVTALATRALMM